MLDDGTTVSIEDPELTVISLDAYRIERNTRFCLHKRRIVDTTVRTVTCKACAAVLDPFNELVQIANDHERIVFRFTDLKKKIAELQTRLAALKAEELNARSRVRRLTTRLRKETKLT